MKYKLLLFLPSTVVPNTSTYIINDTNNFSKRKSKEIEIYYFSEALRNSGKKDSSAKFRI